MSSNGETPRSSEPYSLTARYPDQATSAQPYTEAQALIFKNQELALSVFRLQLRRLAPELGEDWFVAVLGDRPSEEYQTQFRRILSTGEELELPDDVLEALWLRRLQLAAEGSQVEHHYGRHGRRLF